jgi:hypothetical protein
MEETDAFVATVGIIFAASVAWVMCICLYATLKAFFESRLKRDLVSRGFSAEEIAQIITCKTPKRFGKSPYEAHGIPPAKPIRQPQHVN